MGIKTNRQLRELKNGLNISTETTVNTNTSANELEDIEKNMQQLEQRIAVLEVLVSELSSSLKKEKPNKATKVKLEKNIE